MGKDHVEVWFKIKKDAEGFPKTRDWELLKCIKLGNVYEVASVPLYLRDIAYGDRVSVIKTKEGRLEFQAVERRGGYSVFQLWLRRGQKDVLPTLKELVDLGLLVEWEGRLLAIAVPPEKDLDQIVSYIRAGKKSGRWGVQDGFAPGRG